MSNTPFADQTLAAECQKFARQLERELAELREDKARLDWLERDGAIPLCVSGKWQVEYDFHPSRCDNKTAKGDTIRAAIDAARKESRVIGC